MIQEFHMEVMYRKDRDNVITNILCKIMYSMSFTMLESSLLQELKEALVEDVFYIRVKLGSSQVLRVEGQPCVPVHYDRSQSRVRYFSAENGYFK